MSEPKILVVDDDAQMRDSLGHLLESAGFAPMLRPGVAQALHTLGATPVDAVLTDVRMPGQSGLDLLSRIGAGGPPVVLMSAHGDIPMAVEAMQSGAYSFVEKPFDPARLITILRHAVEAHRLSAANTRLGERLEALSGLDRILLGQGAAMQRLREAVLDSVGTEANTMLLGETGTGKELVARALHDLGPHREGPFLAVNCAAIPPERFEELLFGRDDDGGEVALLGHFRAADGGTLFLDEIGACDVELQSKLLRVLEAREVLPLGSSQPVRLDLRVVTATNEDLRQAMAGAAFREDLYFRLSAIEIHLPALRDHADDIPLLFAHFLREYATLYEIAPPEVEAEDVSRLLTHDWPGNVRELRHVAERRVLAARRGGGSVAAAMRRGDAAGDIPATLREAVAVFERELIARTIRAHEGRMDVAAEALGIGRRTLNEKMVKLNLDRDALI
ncbi:sigma-54-dependent transcriptional regulator [Oceanibium sediminis]|uniref:sigma-54-dependent transcriptional regulator n=1 Tax=Oceanibium sediminis TaxID=2026339 RepID=UPI000DD467FD|nr:sigma-54 dependent transcriptional regulator [Oceanibium sediminis]